jgi:hypothetical protein
MAFIFSTSHLPETRVRRPDHLEDEEEGDLMQPMPRAGGVRAFSHLPVRDNPAPSTGPLREDSPREGIAPIPPRSATPTSPAPTRLEDQDDPPPSEANPEDAPAPQDQADDRPWYMPRITAQDLPPQDHPEDAHAPAPKPWENTTRSSGFDDAPPAASSTRSSGFSPSPQELRDAFHPPAPRSPVGQAPAQDSKPALPGGRLFEQRSAPEAFLRQQMGKGASGTSSQQRLQESQRTLTARQQPVRESTPPSNGNNPAAPSQPVSPYQGPAPDKMDEGRGASPRNNSEVKEAPTPLPPRSPDALPQSGDKAVKASSSSSEGCGSKGDLYDIPDATIDNSLTAADILKKNQDEGGLALTERIRVRVGNKIKATATVKKDANGNYAGYVCIPRIYTYIPTSYIAKPQLRWTSGKPGADTADITANTVADMTEHEKAHIKVDQSVGRRISKYYLENVFKIKTKPYATEEEAKKKVLNMEQMFFLKCHSAFLKMRETYNNKHLPANIRAYKGGSGTEWYEPNPDWFTSQGLDDMIQDEPVNVPLPTDP